MKTKYADVREDASVLDKIYKQIEVDDYEFKGYICYTNAIKTASKFEAHGKLIFDSGFSKLQLFAPGKKYVLTAIYDRDDNLVELYFDIAKKVGMSKDGIPYQEDMYIDVVVYGENDTEIIDEEELKAAFEKGEITEKEYKGALRYAKKVCNVFSKYYSRTKRYIDNYYKELKSR